MSKTVKESQSIISIHAPTRGATYKPPLTNPVNGISIHAPTRGATVPFFYLVSYFLLFQSTLLQEERHCSLSSKIYSSIISIHAPTRGATQPCYWIILHLLFQSTLLQEERQSVCTQELNATIFQSTLLQEERLFLL